MKTMNKAFIFDMDGVIINSESIWEQYEQKFLSELIGQERYFEIKDQLLGNSINQIYNIICTYGVKLSKQKYIDMYDEYAKRVYAESQLTDGIETLIEKLSEMKFKLGLVTSSRQKWIDLVLAKVKKKTNFHFVLSLNDSENLRPKPYPDGYLYAIEKLGAKPNTTYILEDSNRGIKAAKASGALTMCLKANLPQDYKAQGADLYFNGIQDVIEFVGGSKL